MLIALGTLLCILIIFIISYVYNNLNYYKGPLKKTIKAGFTEKLVTLADGTILNYAEGPNNGPPLLLIHGQIVAWEDYTSVLPDLSKHYHIYAVDCHGHGKSSHNPEKYNVQAMGEDFVWFIKNIIKKPTVISGHSSGGLLTAWIAANSPENVIGIILEDPPFFTTEPSRCEKTFAWVDSFEPIHRFLQQAEEKDYILFYLNNSYWLKFFGKGRKGILKYATSYREKHPHDRLEIFYLPPSINRTFFFMNSYDPKFGDAFYDCSWNKNFNHSDNLSKIKCPSVLIHTNWKYDGNQILLSAMDDQDAKRAHSLIKYNVLINLKCGHDSHYEKPKEFTQIMIDFLNKIK